MPKADGYGRNHRLQYRCITMKERSREFPDFGKLAVAAAVGGVAAVVISRNFLETEKKLSQMIVTDYGVTDAPFVRTMSQLLGPPLLGGNKVVLLQNGVQIFPRMVEAIRSAERSVTFENFVLVDGEIARSFADAMCERARNGVKVHFL